MKLVKMSLAAAMLMSVQAFAVENVKISGNANVFYSTTDREGQTSNVIVGETDGTLFDKDSSAADASLNLSVSADLFKNDLVSVSGAASYAAIGTLGLENNLVSNVWGGSHTPTTKTAATYGDLLGGAKVENASWFTEAWVAATAGKSTLKLGRMELDTPLAFTEKWSIEKNTFEAVVAVNQDIPDTTVVLAFIGNGNGTEAFGQNRNSLVADLTPAGFAGHRLAVAPVVNGEGKFATYGTDGAYAAAIVNNSFKPLTLQAWYYDVSRLVQAYWLQADLNMEGILFGVQYSAHELDTKTGAEDIDSNVFAVMAGYEMKDVATIKVAYSAVAEDFAAGFNTATNNGHSKLYTESYWNRGYVTQADTSTFGASVSAPVAGMADVHAKLTMVDQAEESGDNDMMEVALIASTSLAALDASLAYIYTDLEALEDPFSTVQARLTFNF